FYAAPRLPLLDHELIAAAFRAPPADAAGRFALLAGRAAQGNSAGRIICSCFGVGETAIRQAVAQGCDSPAALGVALKCGTNCGSCLPELKLLLSTPATA
ncbi:(2Fe-2S)-binding protein, partial [Pantoea piersonii]